MGLHPRSRDQAPIVLIVCDGFFRGEDFRVESGGLLNPSLTVQQPHTRVHKGLKVVGWACKGTPQEFVLFNTRVVRAPLPWEGEGCGVFSYHVGALPHCTPTW